MADVEARELEYFVAVAEELHFGRAAERLHVVQPAVSRAIRRLESRLGVSLLVRDSRNVVLTPAGDALLYHARQVLDGIALATSTTRAVDRQSATLRLVMKPCGDGGLLVPLVEAWERDPGAPHVDVLFDAGTDRVDYLHDGRGDVAFLYDPLDDLSGLDSVVLLEEDRVAVLPAGHRLASMRALRMADLEGETMARWKGVPDSGTGPEVSTMSEFAMVVSLGRAVTVLPRSTVGVLAKDVVTVPIRDAEPSRTVLAWAATNSSPIVRAFAATAEQVARRGSG